MFKKFLVIIAYMIVAGFLPAVIYAAEVELPVPVGYVNDFENILDNDEELELQLSQFQKDTSTEIAVVTVTDFGGTTIEDYAFRLFDEWGIGTEENDNGVLILVSSSQRESRIEVGYGLEGALPDALTGRIQDNEMIPFFREDDYSSGIAAGVEAVISATAGEYTMEDTPYESEGIPILVIIIIIVVIFFIIKNPAVGPVVNAVSTVSRFSGSPFRSSGSSSRRSSGFGGFGGGRSGGGGSSRSW